MNKKYFLLSIIVFLLAFGIRVFYINQKQGFHMDEILSKVISVGRMPAVMQMLNNYDRYATGKQIKDFYFDKPEHSLAHDLKVLWLDNYGDDSHPSLYYSLLRITAEFFDNSVQGFINFGCGLNLIFFTFSFFIMRKILIRLFGDNKLVPIGLVFAFLNTGTISMTLFIRPYELQILATLLISYTYLIYADKVNDYALKLKDFIIIVLSFIFVLWSGYFISVYACVLGCILLWKAKSNLRNVILLALSALCSFVLIKFVYNGYYFFLEGHRFSNVTHTQSIFTKTDYLLKFITYFCNIAKYLFYSCIIITSFIALFFARIKNEHNGKSIFFTALFLSLVAAIIAPFDVVRYITPTFAIISICLLYLLQKMPAKSQTVFAILFVSLYIVSALFPTYREANDVTIYYGTQKNAFKLGGSLENLYISSFPKLNSNIPVLIKNRIWYTPLYIISKLEDNQMYKFDSDNSDIFNLKEYPSKHFYLFVDLVYQSFEYNRKSVELKDLGIFMRYHCFEVFVKS